MPAIEILERVKKLLSCRDEVMRLHDFLRITHEWEQTEKRRCQLIEKRFKHGRTAEEEAEFKELQRLFYLRRSYLAWNKKSGRLRQGPLKSPLP